ncbi:MAG: DNA polymerase/3'-5' exonuclease PolX [Gemmatimonadetes bacterium]|nr:DNA polymerase/3'-5' exonuclease PolX [Gemmatimonadota bacterium]
MENVEIAGVLEELGNLLEIQGSNPFRIRAYRNAVLTVRGLTRPLAAMVEEGEDLTALPAIGKDMSAHIVELIQTGGLARLAEVSTEIPRSLVQLVKLDGVGPKKAKKLWESLGVTTVDELEVALKAGRVESLAGFGATSVAKILASIDDFRRYSGRFLLSKVDALIEPLLAHMREAPGVERIEVAGSYRRRKETIGDVDLLVQAELPAPAVMEHFTAFGSVEKVVAAGDTRGSVVLRSGLEVDLRVIPARSFGAALHYFTGSKEHNVAVRQIAQRQGLRVNEWGVFRMPEGVDPADVGKEDGERVAGETESSVFEVLGMGWVPPVLRENRGEVEAALGVALDNGVPDLVTLEDIQGDLHMHSTWSDGKASVEEMARACKARGYRYLAMSDHSPALAMVGGITPERAVDQWEEIDQVQGGLDGITIFKSLEVDILRDGSLDMTDEVLEALDLVLVSVHSLMEMDRVSMTDRVITAIQHPQVDILAHPTGRLLGRREPFQLEMEEVLQAARDLDVAVEINANPSRLDLNDVHAHRAKELGVKVCINTDAHSVQRLDHMSYGVDQARRAWLSREDVLNTMTLAQFREWLERRDVTTT